MANSKNDDMDRSGNKITPQGSTQNTPQSQNRDTMNRDREQGGNLSHQGQTPPQSFNRDSGDRGPTDANRESENPDSSRDSGRGPNDTSE